MGVASFRLSAEDGIGAMAARRSRDPAEEPSDRARALVGGAPQAGRGGGARRRDIGAEGGGEARHAACRRKAVDPRHVRGRISPRCRRTCAVSASRRESSAMPSDDDDRGDPRRDGRLDGARRQRRRVRRGRRVFRRRVPLHARTAAQIRREPLLRHADQRTRHRRRGDRHGRLWPPALRRSAVRRLCLSRL